MPPATPVLIVVGGLPGAGKTTIATAFVRAAGASYLRIDTIEQAMVDHSELSQPLGPAGYEVAYAVAGEQLRVGVPTVLAECVNPLRITRDAWQRTAASAQARLVDVEVVCSDPREHRRRVETRTTDVPHLVLPTWLDVEAREYETWHRDRIVIDTAEREPEQCAAELAAAVDRVRAS